MKKEKVIILNDEEYVVGRPALTLGLDDDCLPVVCPATITEWDEESNRMCDEGMTMPIRTTCADGHIMDMSKEFWVANVANLRKLNKYCEEKRKEYAARIEVQLKSLA